MPCLRGARSAKNFILGVLSDGPAAKAGEPWAMSVIGYRLLRPEGKQSYLTSDQQDIERGRQWLRRAIGAAVLHPRRTIPEGFNLLTEQSRFLLLLAGNGPVTKQIAVWAYKMGVFFALFGSIQGAMEIYTHSLVRRSPWAHLLSFHLALDGHVPAALGDPCERATSH